MTTELEQEFFNVFGIEPKIYKTDGRDIDDNGDVCSWYIEEVYPEITDRKLLEMICILNSICGVNCTAYEAKSIEALKEEILIECLALKDEKNLHYEIQQLFKEGE